MNEQPHKNKFSFLRYFDLKMGIVGGLFLGTIVFLINFDHGAVNALIAASKQATYTFFAGGFMLRLTENIATSIDNFYKAIITACLVSTSIAVTLTFIVHSLRGTPEPLNSTIPTMIFSPWAFLWWAIRKKRRQLKTVGD
ncbi:MAG: hypothetical protein GXO86_13220 [Chlorobi bacterium]|nr:hypothetical protein [Chlorobiota bacterium]